MLLTISSDFSFKGIKYRKRFNFFKMFLLSFISRVEKIGKKLTNIRLKSTKKVNVFF